MNLLFLSWDWTKVLFDHHNLTHLKYQFEHITRVKGIV
ncbi:hypothetical protein LEWO105114_07370 [Legionella worsleiensis]|nr:Uncharacterised protein [Legionella worsleiensis]